MQTRDRSALIVAALRRRGVARAQELAGDLTVSQATVSRLLAGLGDRVVAIGETRRRRYALARGVRGLPDALALHRVDRAGRPIRVGTLRTIEPRGSILEPGRPLGWPRDEEMQRGLYPGLPYFIADARPQGFLGRAYARRLGPQLGVPEDPNDWSEEHALVALVRAGDDLPGDLLLGDAALEAHQRRRAAGLTAIDEGERERAYPALAQAAIEGEAPGSSAGGEFPKFTAAVRARDAVRHCIVKFSPADDSPGAKRWADLLVAEHLAASALAALDVVSVATALVRSGGRVFLEVRRFDRESEFGRAGVVTLASLEPALLGLGNPSWEAAATALARRGWLSDADMHRVARLAAIGRLIANSDMHAGNVAFLPAGEEEGLALAPAYDMLPMLYAPTRQGEIPVRRFAAPPPQPGFEADWATARDAAARYWHTLAADARLSDAFRRIAAANAASVGEAGRRFG